MTKDFSELVDYLDKRFTDIGDEVRGVRSDVGHLQLDMTQVQSEVSILRERVDAIYTGLDAYAKKADSYFQEMLMLATKVDRHEKWLHQMAEKLGIKLEY